MPSNDEKKPEQESGKIVSFKEKKTELASARGKAAAAAKPRHHLSIGWWFGIIVLVLISVSFVLAPALEAFVSKDRGKGLVFGTYDGENITFIQGGYFYDQYQRYANQYNSRSSANATQAVYQIWRSAYESTVFYTAINQMARKAGIIAANAVVNRKIIESGYYDKDGKFDVATYNAASAEKKANIETNVRRGVPMSIVLNDVSSVLSSTGELDYVASMADNGRAFHYVAFDATTYPNDETSKYALQNPQLFYQIDFSLISAGTEEEAKAILDKINDRSQTFEEAAVASSTDSFASAEGKVGAHRFFEVSSLFKNADDAQKLFSAKEGEIIGPVESSNGWMLIRLDGTPVAADYTDQATLDIVKKYIGTYDSATMDDYLRAEAEAFAADAKKSSFEEVADAGDIAIIDVPATPMNVGSSSLLGSFAYSDPGRRLTAIQSDGAIMRTLFSGEEGALSAPIKSGSSYIVVKSGAKAQSGMKSYLSTYYDYIAGSANQQDLQYGLLNSEKHKDNFLSVFLTNIMGTPST